MTIVLTGGVGISTPDITSGSYNQGQLAGFRNKIINGKMEIVQRGTSFAGVTAGATYVTDRWRLVQLVSPAVGTITQQADVPSSNEFQYSLRYAVTTADASIGATAAAWISQPIEGFNISDLIGRDFTVSFWARSSKTGTHCIALKSDTYSSAYIAEYTISAANTWENKTVTVTGGLPTAGTWNYTNGFGLDLVFALAVGSNFQTTAGAWQTGNFVATANQVNCLDTAGNIFAITGVQLEAGDIATPFEHRPYGIELALCQRYYQTGITHTVTGGMPTAIWHTLQTAMRSAPTVTATLVGGGGPVYSSFNVTSYGFRYISLSSPGGGVADYSIVASAEL